MRYGPELSGLRTNTVQVQYNMGPGRRSLAAAVERVDVGVIRGMFTSDDGNEDAAMPTRRSYMADLARRVGSASGTQAAMTARLTDSLSDESGSCDPSPGESLAMITTMLDQQAWVSLREANDVDTISAAERHGF